LKIVALARHADGDVADAGPGVQPGGITFTIGLVAKGVWGISV
jgi:hypothetical protein